MQPSSLELLLCLLSFKTRANNPSRTKPVSAESSLDGIKAAWVRTISTCETTRTSVSTCWEPLGMAPLPALLSVLLPLLPPSYPPPPPLSLFQVCTLVRCGNSTFQLPKDTVLAAFLLGVRTRTTAIDRYLALLQVAAASAPAVACRERLGL